MGWNIHTIELNLMDIFNNITNAYEIYSLHKRLIYYRHAHTHTHTCSQIHLRLNEIHIEKLWNISCKFLKWKKNKYGETKGWEKKTKRNEKLPKCWELREEEEGKTMKTKNCQITQEKKNINFYPILSILNAQK